MGKEMERAKKEIKEREERKALTGGAAKEGQLAEPRMNIKGAKLGKMAKGRHQLTTLLAEAYQNREALEDRIAEGGGIGRRRGISMVSLGVDFATHFADLWYVGF
jgi:proline-rich protein PRCC